MLAHGGRGQGQRWNRQLVLAAQAQWSAARHQHLQAGARFVILSAPARTETVATVVHGVNQAPDGLQVVSCASCTTNCITPVVEVLGRRIGIERAIMSTVHAYTAGQRLIDGPSKDVRREKRREDREQEVGCYPR